jgi:hypothetical protein
MEGVAQIMQTFSDPIKHCSSVIGRSLFEWYCSYEDYCCINGIYKMPLPKQWRNANVQIRQELANREYPGLTATDRQSRLLDDLWPQLRAMSPKFNDILMSISVMQKLEGRLRFEAATRLEFKLQQLIKEVTDLMNSSDIKEILRPAPTVPVISTSPTSLPPPYVPYICQYPPAGYFRTVLYGILAYMRCLLLPPLLFEMDQWIITIRVEERDPFVDSIEVCRTYAGLEHAFGSNPISLFSCWSALILVATTCPPDLREWTWSKLIRFENLGQPRLEAVKKHIATLWQTPEILEHSSETGFHQREKRVIDIDDNSTLIPMIENVDLHADSGLDGDGDEMESLMYLRGLFWNHDES